MFRAAVNMDMQGDQPWIGTAGGGGDGCGGRGEREKDIS